MVKIRFLQSLAIGFLVLYLGVAFGGWFSLDALSPYADYLFEAAFGWGVFAIFRKWTWAKGRFTLGAGVAFFFVFAMGFAVYESASLLGYAVPFAMKDPETVLFLLLVGPVLEEWVFRGALWKLLEVITGSPWPAFLGTAVLFSYAHYQVIGSVEPHYASFVRYQAIYTLGLGLLCGGVRLQHGWRGALLAHMSFNFGFWLGAL